ncbi:unnamed protein product [Miscanthus lutarioriparius]|uniref:Cation/H+ exchanger domain-containing protein n=1 Tax=Miscanthus lutarioriparius TaxID=422564 RepID=A0A811RBF7_9POAL|nr:unnamed protein product [Miscanthus lutarioriparius]
MVAVPELARVPLAVAGAHLLASPPRALRQIHGEDRLWQLHAGRLLALTAAVGDEAASLHAGALAVAVGARVGVRRRSPVSGTRHAASRVRVAGDRGGSAPRIFVFGLTVPNGPVGVAIVEKVEDFVVGMLLPLFFAMSRLRTDTTKITSTPAAVLVMVAALAVAILKVATAVDVAAVFGGQLHSDHSATSSRRMRASSR